MSQYRERDIIEVLKDYAWIGLVGGIVGYMLFTEYDVYFFLIWKWCRMGELFFWHFLTFPFGTNFFLEGINVLRTTAPIHMDWEWFFEFEAYFNVHLRFVYASFFFAVGSKLFYNFIFVTKPLDVQSMMEMYAKESKALEVLAYDNPLKHNIVYDFSNRCDYHNRHAQGIQPSQFMTACPPPLASLSEMAKHNSLVNQGRDSIFRPIAKLDRKVGIFAFSRERARRTFERQLTNPPATNPFYLDENNAPRLFDESGELIPLQKNEKGQIIGGFSTNKLLNNGREYNGSAANVALLFNHVEREVYFELCSRYQHPTIPLEVLVVELARQHAFTRTYLVSLLNLVRENEVIASTEFYLLQRKDRVLYFALYSASEEKPFWEGTGVMAHYHHEIELGAAVSTPQVTTAVDALEKEYRRLKKHEPDFHSIFERLTHELSNQHLLDKADPIPTITEEGELAILGDINKDSQSSEAGGSAALTKISEDAGGSQ
ncbi:conserved membrane hypothetical protein [Vibrio nigripulchritudo SOn1]|uniref:DotM C-terminal cytoplasmic domain-containing protein n=1 Tax=Vibrio nigripulchritudo SOn1 TaxID=1238450 RepID=A0AAV2VQG4_9VIBR|nr:hypothetical protein [Vibrio nigripulchritudo]CCO46792.1 conserved membrane hypothetical protein [Vibrio nigripulchritudo SOn1]